MGSDDDLLALEELRLDLLLKIGEDTLGRQLEGLAAGRGDVVGAAPDVDL